MDHHPEQSGEQVDPVQAKLQEEDLQEQLGGQDAREKAKFLQADHHQHRQ
jgi:hypothetical protein